MTNLGNIHANLEALLVMVEDPANHSQKVGVQSQSRLILKKIIKVQD